MSLLDPPHIQLGAYWHDTDETAAFNRVLAWLGSRGCRPAGDMLAFRNCGGKLPRFQSLYLPRPFDRADERHTVHWTLHEAVSLNDWLPVGVRMKSAPPESMELDLAHAAMGDHSFRTGDAHVIEITLSGAEADRVQNCTTEALPPEIVSAAEAALRWSRQLFRAICDELVPSYAAYRWERALDAPTSLLASRDCRDYEDLFVADDVIAFDELVHALRGLRLATVNRYRAGAYLASVHSPERTAEDERAFADAVAALLRKGLRAKP